jgi:hypothetical protein
VSATATRDALSDEQLVDLLRLTRGADSIELKLTVPADAQRSALTAIGLDPLDAQVRMVSFFDTPDLRLQAHGVVVRARRVQGKGDDSVVKLRPVVPDHLPPSLRESRGCVVEVDAMPGGYVCSATLKAVPRKATVADVNAGRAPLRKLLSKDQRAFYTENAPEGLGLDDLALLGPVFVLKVKGTPPGTARKLVAEVWLYPDGSRILELSAKCGPGEGLQVAGELRAWLSERGVALDGRQETKTRAALEYFSRALTKPRSSRTRRPAATASPS